MDLISDQRFLEAVLQYCQVLPTANLWQDETWQTDMEHMQGLRDISHTHYPQHQVEVRTEALAPPRSFNNITSPPVHSRLRRASDSAVPSPVMAEIVPVGDERQVHSVDPAPGERAPHKPGNDLSWLVQKEEAELAMLKGQSSVWFFLENFSIGSLAFNVTLALSSNFKADNAAQGSSGRSQVGTWQMRENMEG